LSNYIRSISFIAIESSWSLLYTLTRW